MDAAPRDAAPSPDEGPLEPREGEPPVRYYRIDFERCVIQRGRRPPVSRGGRASFELT